MTVEKEDYEELLSVYSSTLDAIELLRLHRRILGTHAKYATIGREFDYNAASCCEASQISTDGWSSIWCNKYI